MASTGKKWAIGCGVGCGLVLLVTLLVGGGMFMAIRDTVKKGESINESFDALVAEYGRPEEYAPSASGAIPARRMEVFLAVRQAMAPSARNLAENIGIFSEDESVQKKASNFQKMKVGFSIIPLVLEHLDKRNDILLEQGMGQGEYTYIYSLAYFDYLDKDVADGPNVRLKQKEGNNTLSFKVGGKAQTREERERKIRRHLHSLHLAFLNNQIEKAGEQPVLATEHEALVNNRHRLLWEEGLPEAVAASIAPYAEELEAGYIPILNLVEMGLMENH
ncbi:hypothetical protein CSB20_05680 [bacterium DOLZORAL124_64_63]|nr:MAG: hypothetical protein CSB20_05680 [bacterium DOLZORAL124_64_63]